MFPRLSVRDLITALRSGAERVVRWAEELYAAEAGGAAQTDGTPESRAATPTAVHPHRRGVSPPRRAGRPGTVAPRPQICRTPITAQRPATRRPAPKTTERQ